MPEVYLWALFWIVFCALGAPARSLASRPHALFGALTVLLVASITLLYALLWAPLRTVAAEEFAAGLILLVAGQGLMLSARAALRGLTVWQVLFELSEVRVRTGPYRLLSHPMYEGLTIALAGSALMAGAPTWGSLVLCAWILPIILLRVWIESRGG